MQEAPVLAHTVGFWSRASPRALDFKQAWQKMEAMIREHPTPRAVSLSPAAVGPPLPPALPALPDLQYCSALCPSTMLVLLCAPQALSTEP